MTEVNDHNPEVRSRIRRIKERREETSGIRNDARKRVRRVKKMGKLQCPSAIATHRSVRRKRNRDVEQQREREREQSVVQKR